MGRKAQSCMGIDKLSSKAMSDRFWVTSVIPSTWPMASNPRWWIALIRMQHRDRSTWPVAQCNVSQWLHHGYITTAGRVVFNCSAAKHTQDTAYPRSETPFLVRVLNCRTSCPALGEHIRCSQSFPCSRAPIKRKKNCPSSKQSFSPFIQRLNFTRWYVIFV